MNAQRHGSPTARCLHLYELRPYRSEIRKFIAGNDNHPALQLAFSEIDKWLRQGSASGSALLGQKPKTIGARLALECLRLSEAGVTGTDVFELVAAIWLLSGRDERRLPRYSREFTFAVGRLVFNLAPRSGKRRLPANSNKARKYTSRLSTALVEKIGKELVIWFLQLLLKIEETLNASERRDGERKQKLASALAQQQFTDQ